jgi:DNA-directed RNA polymerase specialized sigma24 family protein
MMKRDEDAVQDVLIVVHQKLQTFNPKDTGKFSWWVHSIISRVRKGTARDVIRRREDRYVDEAEYSTGDNSQFQDITALKGDLREIASLLLSGRTIQESAAVLGLKPDSLTKKVRRACPKMAA